MTLLIQYLTIAKIYDDYNEIEESLTFERIEFINDTIQEHETIVAEHEQKTAEMMANSTREKKGQDRKFREVGEAIAITHKKKMVETRGETVQRIANNVYVPTDDAKAGFVHNPFGDEGDNNQSVKTKTVNDEAEQNNPQTKAVNDEDRQDEANKKLNMNDFEFLHRNMIALLFKGDTINRHDRLRTRDEVVKILHKQGHGRIRDLNTSMTELYTKLIEMNVIYKKVAYFSNMDKGIL